MAVFEISMFSRSLGHITHITAIVPTELRRFPGGPEPTPAKNLRSLILLHGYSGIDTTGYAVQASQSLLRCTT